MKCYTIKGGKMTDGIQVVNGNLIVGEEGRGRKLVRVQLPDGSEVVGLRGGAMFEVRWPKGKGKFRGFLCEGVDRWKGAEPSPEEAAQIAAQGGTWNPASPDPLVGTVVTVPVKNQPEGAVLVMFRDASGFRGGWSLSVRKGVIVVAEGACAQGDAGRMGGGPEILAIVLDGGSAIISRSGRLYGAAATLRVSNVGGVLTVEDALLFEEQKAAASALAGL